MRGEEGSLGWCNVSELRPEFVDQWRDLFEDSHSPNIYLSPDFILTALNTFCGDSPRVAWIGSEERLDALAVLEKQEWKLTFPASSYRLFKSIHSMQSGLLIRRGIEDANLDAFMRSLFEHSASSLHFEDFCPASEAAKKIYESAQRQNIIWHETYRYDRAVLDTDITIE